MHDGWELHKPGVWRKHAGDVRAEVFGGVRFGSNGWHWVVTRGHRAIGPHRRFRVYAGNHHDPIPTRKLAMALADACLEVLDA